MGEGAGNDAHPEVLAPAHAAENESIYDLIDIGDWGYEMECVPVPPVGSRAPSVLEAQLYLHGGEMKQRRAMID